MISRQVKNSRKRKLKGKFNSRSGLIVPTYHNFIGKPGNPKRIHDSKNLTEEEVNTIQKIGQVIRNNKGELMSAENRAKIKGLVQSLVV